jgi:hypothetical protein
MAQATDLPTTSRFHNARPRKLAGVPFPGPGASSTARVWLPAGARRVDYWGLWTGGGENAPMASPSARRGHWLSGTYPSPSVRKGWESATMSVEPTRVLG